MSTTTTNYGLTKPSGSDRIDIAVLNADLDTVDTTLYANSTGLSALTSTVSTKADASVVAALTSTVSAKASASDVVALTSTVAGKADKGTTCYNVKDHGVTGDGTTDDTTALQAVFNTICGYTSPGTNGENVYFPPGEYKITDTIAITRFTGTMMGAGIGQSPAYTPRAGHGSVIKWAGSAGIPMFQVRDSRDYHFKNLRFEGYDDAPPSYAIELIATSGYDGAGYNHRGEITGCWFGRYPWTKAGTNKGIIDSGIGFTGSNANNDQFRIVNCGFAYCTTYGIYLPNAQSVWGSIRDVVFDTCGTAISTCANLSISNIGCSYSTVCDLVVGSTATVTVDSFASEHCTQWLSLGVYARVRVIGGSIQQVGVQGSANQTLIGAYPADAQTLVVENVMFGTVDDPAHSKIILGPASPYVGSFYAKFVACRGLSTSQFSLGGSMWAALSTGILEYVGWGPTSTLAEFRNELRGGTPGAGQRATISTSHWDTPAA